MANSGAFPRDSSVVNIEPAEHPLYDSKHTWTLKTLPFEGLAYKEFINRSLRRVGYLGFRYSFVEEVPESLGSFVCKDSSCCVLAVRDEPR